MQTIVLCNPTSDKRVTSDDLIDIAQGLNAWAQRDLAKFYGSSLHISGITQGMRDSYWLCHLIPTLDDPDAIAYHMMGKTGMPELFVGIDEVLQNGGTIKAGANSLSAAASHEIGEADRDPWCIKWSDYSSSEVVAYEIHDPCQGDSYEVNGVSVSNFVTDEWFNPLAPEGTQLDFMGNIKTPLMLAPGGYMVLRAGGMSGKIRNVFGEKMPEWQKLQKIRHGRRARHSDKLLRKRG